MKKDIEKPSCETVKAIKQDKQKAVDSNKIVKK